MRGKETIRAWLETSHDRIQDITLGNRHIDGDGSAAYKIATFRTRYIADGSTDVLTAMGWHLWVMRRDDQGTWRVEVVAWSVVES